MRSCFSLALVILATPLAAQDPLAFLRPHEVAPDAALVLYKEQPYRPIRVDEARAAGFLTEGRILPFGKVLGPVTPAQVRSTSTGALAMTGMVIGIRAPEGATYQAGDTVILATVKQGPKGWGDIVVPTGLARVDKIGERQSLATVIATYGAIRDGQVTLPLEPVKDPGKVQPVAATGPSGTIISSQAPRELQQPSGILFIDLGRETGVRPGDFLEIRRRVVRRQNASDTIEEVMATAQVLRVNDHSSTIKLLRVIDPGIAPGPSVVRIATLPN
jgi:hypothetical protein